MSTKLANDQLDSVWPVVNVRDFGAVGDASTDDSAAFLAAWEEAKRLSAIDDSYNGEVHIPQGDYYLASGVIFDDTNASGKVKVTGSVQNDCNIIIGADQVGLDFDCGAPTCEDLTVWSKPTWDATVAASGSLTVVRDTSGIGVRSLIGGRPRFKNLTVYGFGDSGIYSTRMTKGLIEWNRVTGCGTGINVPTPSTTTTTSHIANNYVSSCDLGYNLNKVTHSTFYNNIAEAGVKGLDASLCTNTIFERMYFESNSDMHYEILNSRCIINDVSEVNGSGGPPANASLFYYNSSVSLSDIFKQEVNGDGIASSHFGLLSYDDGGGSTKGFVKNEFLPTQTRQVRGLRINNRETKSGAINAIGTFPLVNGAKAAHLSTLHIKDDGTVITNDDMINSVTKVAAGEYEIALKTQTYPDWVHATPYVSYTTGATTPRFATVSYNNGAGLNDFTDYDGGNIVSRIYVVIFDVAGSEVDCGFTVTVGWNMDDDLLS